MNKDIIERIFRIAKTSVEEIVKMKNLTPTQGWSVEVGILKTLLMDSMALDPKEPEETVIACIVHLANLLYQRREDPNPSQSGIQPDEVILQYPDCANQ